MIEHQIEYLKHLMHLVNYDVPDNNTPKRINKVCDEIERYFGIHDPEVPQKETETNEGYTRTYKKPLYSSPTTRREFCIGRQERIYKSTL